MRAVRAVLMGRTITDAATRVGLADQSHLNRWFRAVLWHHARGVSQSRTRAPEELTGNISARRVNGAHARPRRLRDIARTSASPAGRGQWAQVHSPPARRQGLCAWQICARAMRRWPNVRVQRMISRWRRHLGTRRIRSCRRAECAACRSITSHLPSPRLGRWRLRVDVPPIRRRAARTCRSALSPRVPCERVRCGPAC